MENASLILSEQLIESVDSPQAYDNLQHIFVSVTIHSNDYNLKMECRYLFVIGNLFKYPLLYIVSSKQRLGKKQSEHFIYGVIIISPIVSF